MRHGPRDPWPDLRVGRGNWSSRPSQARARSLSPLGRPHHHSTDPHHKEKSVNTRIKTAIAIPQTSLDGALSIAHIRDFLARAEALGYESAWVVERVLGAICALESVGLLTYAAAVTTRMRLGSAVLLTALRNPVHLAKSLATLDQLSGGRLIIR